MRADARRNRELITTTALDLFTEHGAAVCMEEIAHAAGLGVGTLYRHFPDRQALLESIALDTLRGLLEFGLTTDSADTSRWQALQLLVEYCAGLPMALIKSMSASLPLHPELLELQRSLDALFERIAEQAQLEGTLRHDIPPREVVGLLNVAVCRPGARADDHLTTVILDGLRSTAP
ncbi:TetR/AcrR family transcriptional regulator [Streptosporangium amethystogenes]|uniref:TetR/AcrR family transcriptional regulator n=1 Tax=Streptosporangium amethystogenes TaxID=2002 RepID=UPI00379294B7